MNLLPSRSVHQIPEPRQAEQAVSAPHAVEFYTDDEVLLRHLEDYIVEGRERGERTVVIATPEHRRALSWRFVEGEDAFLGLDAQETLEKFMVGGLPDPVLFEQTIGALVRAEAEVGVRAYGEMVALLWAGDNADGTIALEQMWNGLQEQVAFPLLCAYPLSDFEQRDGLDRVCDTHSHIGLPPLKRRSVA